MIADQVLEQRAIRRGKARRALEANQAAFRRKQHGDARMSVSTGIREHGFERCGCHGCVFRNHVPHLLCADQHGRGGSLGGRRCLGRGCYACRSRRGQFAREQNQHRRYAIADDFFWRQLIDRTVGEQCQHAQQFVVNAQWKRIGKNLPDAVHVTDGRATDRGGILLEPLLQISRLRRIVVASENATAVPVVPGNNHRHRTQQHQQLFKRRQIH